MAAGDPKDERDRDRDWRSLLLFLLILLPGFACLMLTAQMAVRPDRMWQIPADMLSQLNPDEDTDTGERRVEPLRPEVLTPPSWDPNFLTPEGTAVVVAPATFVPVRPGTPTPGEVAVVPTPSPSATALTPTPTQTPTPTGTPTPTTTPTPTSTPTTTSTPTATPSSTPTTTSTPTPTTETPPQPTRPSPTPTHTPTPTPTIVPPPSILSITPNWGVNSLPVPVVIRGSDFYGMPTARLGTSVPIAISAATTDTLTGTVPAGITPGVYALVVENPDGQSAILSPAYTALAPATTLETGDMVTFGTAASSPGNGDNDQVQVIFLTVPNTITDTLYVRILDPDVGGSGAFDERSGGWDTSTAFSLYGGSGAYSPAARQATFVPSDPGISSGTLINSQTFAEDALLDGNWYTFAAVNPNQGDAVGSRYIFKLSVVGANNGDDGNRYNVALSTDPLANEPPAGARIFAYSWTFPLYASSTKRLYPYVPSGAQFFSQHNWDMDGAGGTMTLLTPIRSITVPSSDISDGGAEASTDPPYRVDANEDGATWTVTMSFTPAGPWDDLTFWADNGSGTAWAIFTGPTMVSPP